MAMILTAAPLPTMTQIPGTTLSELPMVPEATEAASETVGEFVSSILAEPWLPWAVTSLIAALIITIVILTILLLCKKKKASAIPTGNITSVRIGKIHGQGAREYQQDSFGLSDPARYSQSGVLAVVADGMGGLKDSGQVSETIVETVLDGFLCPQGQGTPEQILLTLTQWAIQEVNAKLGPENYRKSGSTMAMGLLKNDRFSWVSVGDSRIYLYRQGQLILLNREHNFKQKLVLQAINGEIPMQEVYTDKRRSGLLSFLGMGEIQSIDFPEVPLPLIPGDQIILMSDGVYNALTVEEMRTALADGPKALEDAILEKDYKNQDNYTAVILSCEAGLGSYPKTEE